VKFAKKFTSRSEDTLAKWKALKPEFYQKRVAVAPPLVPFYGTKIYATLSQQERTDLGELFLRFNAEALIIFEQFLLCASRSLIATAQDPKLARAIELFRREELAHITGFRRFLQGHFPGEYRNQDLVMGLSRGLKNAMAWVTLWEPLSFVIPGSKSETYSIYFARYLVKHAVDLTDPWIIINQMHLLDEVHHVAFDFDFFDNRLMPASFLKRAKVVVATLMMIVLVQLILAVGGWNLIQRGLRRRTRWQRFVLFGHFIHWVLRTFPPYPSTRAQLAGTFRRREFRLFRLFLFTTW
jgi:hypothetical protein